MWSGFDCAQIDAFGTNISCGARAPGRRFSCCTAFRKRTSCARRRAAPRAPLHSRLRRSWRLWRERLPALVRRPEAVDGGHFFPEEKPEETARRLEMFLVQ